jgi:hypothetical protein
MVRQGRTANATPRTTLVLYPSTDTDQGTRRTCLAGGSGERHLKGLLEASELDISDTGAREKASRTLETEVRRILESIPSFERGSRILPRLSDSATSIDTLCGYGMLDA